MTQAQRQAFAREVWIAFKDHAAISPRLTLDQMSPAEWYIMEGWMTRDIPLRVVLRAFEDCKQREARTLLYLAGPVEQAYRHWLEAVS